MCPPKPGPRLRRKVYEIDPLLCPYCGAEMKVIAFIEDHKVIDNIITGRTHQEFEVSKDKGNVLVFLAFINKFFYFGCYLMESTAMKIAFINVERACFKHFSRASTVIFVSSTSFFSIASRTPGSVLAE